LKKKKSTNKLVLNHEYQIERYVTLGDLILQTKVRYHAFWFCWFRYVKASTSIKNM